MSEIATIPESNIPTNKKQNPLWKNFLISIGMLLIAAVLLLGWFILRPDNKKDTYDLFNIEIISELSTLEYRYHNVSVLDKEGNALSKGKQYVWLEYDVIVEIGIDTNEVIIEPPTTEGVVKVYLPPARILSAKEDKSTITKPVCDLGWQTELTAKDERQIINDGIEKLKIDIEKQKVISQSYNAAKSVLKQRIITIGELMGEEYTVEWIKTPDVSGASTDTTK